jgi:hypothetical protein
MLNELTLSPKTRTFFIYFLSLFFVFFLFPTDFYTLPYAGVDGSWQVGIHLAIKYHLLFGKDFVYTYGPLAALRLRFPIVLSKWAYIVSDCYYAYILFVAFSSFIRSHFRPGPLLFLFCCVVIGQDWEMDKWYQFLLLLFLMNFLRQPEKKVYLLHAAVLALITFYIKVNAGLINIGFFLLVVHYALAVKKLEPRTYIFLLISFLAALLLSARLFGASLGSYILCTLYILKDYEDIMYLPLGGRLGELAPWFAGIFLLAMFACYVFVLLKIIRGRRLPAQLDTVVTYLLVAAAIFIWYKNAFVRADGHVFQFFVMAGPLAFFLYIFTPPELGKRTVAVFCWAMLGIDVCSLLLLPDSGFPDKMGKLFNFSLITAKVRSVGHYAEGIRNYDRAKAVTDSTTSLPSPYRQAVGDHTTDIIPTEISLLYANGLRYAPRPTAQSYAAYDSYLDRLNYERYLSPQAPDYVFFTLDGTEDRSAWMDEGRIKLALLARYRPERMVADQLLLKKQELPRDMIKIKEDTIRTEMGKEIPVEKGPGILFTRFLVERNWAGKFRSFVYQPPDLVMEYKLQDGEVRYFKVFKPLLEDGMVLNKFVNSTAEFRLFLLSDGQLNENVHSVRLQPTEQGGYQPKIRVINTWYAFAPRSAGRLQQDSLDLLRLTHNHTPLPPMAHPPSGNDSDSIRYGLEYIRNHAGLIRIAGWAMHLHRDNRNYIVKVLARSVDSVYELPSEKYSIPAYPYDLWSRVDLDSSGFLSVFSKDQVPKGNYQLGIAIYHRDNDSNSVQYFDRYFDVEAPYRLQAIARVDAAGEKSENIKYGIDFIGSEDDQLVIRGWAVLPATPHRSPINLLLQNDTATYSVNATPQRRTDIEGFFKDSGFLFSGFTAFLPRTSGPKGVFHLGIEKISPDGRTRSRVFTSSKLRLGLPENFTPVRTDSLPSTGTAYGNFDTIDDEDDFVTIGGWALLDTLHGAPDRIQIVFRNGRNNFVTPAVDQTSRPDIAGKYRNNDMMDAGFSARIEKTSLPKGKYQLGLYVHARSNAAPGLLLLNRFIEKK